MYNNSMNTIVVGSENPVKISAVEAGFMAMFPNEEFHVLGVSVESGVADQPMNDTDTLLGATNRAMNAKKVNNDADYVVGLEGGIEELEDSLCAFAWIVVISKNGRVGMAKTAVFFLPKEVETLVRSGIELGKAMDQIFGVKNSKHSSGSTGLLTDGVLNRTEYYKQAVILALIPHKNTGMQF